MRFSAGALRSIRVTLSCGTGPRFETRSSPSSVSAAADRRHRIHDEAIVELRRVAAWYDERRLGLGNEFVLALDGAISTIMDAPDRWPHFAGANRYVLTRFPYNIIFRSDDRELVILAVAHHRRRPGYWRRRP